MYSSQSNPAERAIQGIEQLIVVMRYDVQARYGLNITAAHILYPWLCRHAGWIRSRFHVKANGRTGYRDAYDADYSGELLPFGETILYRVALPSHRRTHGRKWHRADAIAEGRHGWPL